jgi:hypothetical protein
MKKSIALLALVTACSGGAVDLGGRTSQKEGTGDAGTLPACGYSVASPECSYTGPCTDGSGYLAGYPSACPPRLSTNFQMLGSVVEAANSLVGIWSECSSGVEAVEGPVRSIDHNARGIEFTSDGRFQLLAFTPSTAGGVFDDTVSLSTDPADTGTYDVVEAESDAGPPVTFYQVELHLSDGSVHSWAFQTWPEPIAKLAFSTPSGEIMYAHTSKRTYNAGLCGAPFGPVNTPDDAQATLARMVGRWIACPKRDAWSPIGGDGFEIEADGSWRPLVADETGNLVAVAGSNFAIAADGGIQQMFIEGKVEALSSSPPTLRFDTGDSLSGSYTVVQPILGACGTLAFAASGGNLQSFQYSHVP